MTLRKISEEVLRRYYAGPESNKTEYHRKEIQLMVAQAINEILKVQHFSENIPNKEMVPPHALIANYTVPVTFYDDGVTSIECTNVSTVGYSDAWVTAGDVEWWTGGGDEWAAYQEADISVTPVSSGGIQSYIFRITGLTTPGDTTDAAVQAAIEDCDNDGYILITGNNIDAGLPTAMGEMRIEFVSVSGTSI